MKTFNHGDIVIRMCKEPDILLDEKLESLRRNIEKSEKGLLIESENKYVTDAFILTGKLKTNEDIKTLSLPCNMVLYNDDGEYDVILSGKYCEYPCIISLSTCMISCA